jgi:hypothetical protein
LTLTGTAFELFFVGFVPTVAEEKPDTTRL